MKKKQSAMAWFLISVMLGNQSLPAFASQDVIESSYRQSTIKSVASASNATESDADEEEDEFEEIDLIDDRATASDMDEVSEDENFGEIDLATASNLMLNDEEIISIPDENLKQALVASFDTDQDGEISCSEMENIDRISAYNSDISSLEGLQYATNATTIELSYNNISDVSPLENLTQLQYLYLSGNNIESISSLSDLTNLKVLYLEDNRITDIVPLQDMSELLYLELKNNDISEMPDFTRLINLQFYDYANSPTIVFAGNKITADQFVGKFAQEPGEDWIEANSYDSEIVEISDPELKNALLSYDTDQDGELSKAELRQMGSFLASNTGITDLTGLEYAVNLYSLDVSNNQLTTVDQLEKLKNLTYLNLQNNKISQIPDLSGLQKLELYDTEWDQELQENVKIGPKNIFGGNHILREEFSGKLPEEVDEPWLSLNAYDSTIVNIPDQALKALLLQSNFDTDQDGELSVSEMQQITYISGPYYGISDLTGLEYATQLDSLMLADNNIYDLTPIRNLSKLIWLDVRRNKLETIPDLSKLERLNLYGNYTTDNGEPFTKPENIFGGNKIERAEFIGKFAKEPDEDWLLLNSYDTTEVNIPDSALRKLLLQSNANLDMDDKMTISEMQQIDTISGAYRGIKDLTGLEYASQLTYLDLSDNSITDASPIQKLTNLSSLILKNNELEQIPDLSGLTFLKLYDTTWDAEHQVTVRTNPRNMFGGNKIKADGFIGKFAEEPGEDWFNLNSYNDAPVKIPDKGLQLILEGYDSDGDGTLTVSDMGKITSLNITNINVYDLTGLEYATSLSSLYMSNTKVEDLTPIANLRNLVRLYAPNNQIKDLTPITGMTWLVELYLSNNQISSLPDLRNLKNLQIYNPWNQSARAVFAGNLLTRDDFSGKLSGELTEEWLLLNSYDPVQVDIPDENLAKLIRRYVPDYGNDGKFSRSELLQLTYLEGKFNGKLEISDLTGLEYAENLQTISLGNNKISSLEPLKNLPKLKNLYLNRNEISDLEPLKSMQSLEYLDLGNNQITTIPDLTALTNLRLYNPYDNDYPYNIFGGNKVLRNEFIGKFAEDLTDDWLEKNSYDKTEVEISDPVLREIILKSYDADGDGKISKSELFSLEEMECKSAGIKDLKGLEQAKFLSYVNLNNNEIGDLTPLSGLKNLQEISLISNKIQDISSLSTEKLQRVYLDNNKIRDISVLEDCSDLRELSVQNNKIESVPDFSKMSNLRLYQETNNRREPVNIFGGNSALASKEQFIGKFAEELTDEWYELNLYNKEIVNIPDRNLKNALIKIGLDDDGDGELTVSNIRSLWMLRITGQNISDLTGLEYAIELEELDISNNQITNLNPLTNCKKLYRLIARNNNLSYLPDWHEAGINFDLYDSDNEDNPNRPLDMFSGNQLSVRLLRKIFDYLDPDDEWYRINSQNIRFVWEDTENGRICYRDGSQIIDECVEIGFEHYYFDQAGYMVKNTWYRDTDGLRYFGNDGAALYGLDDGVLDIKSIDGADYAFDEDGYALTGWVFSDGIRAEEPEDWMFSSYYFDPETAQMQTGWQKLNVYGGWKSGEGTADYWFYFMEEGHVGEKLYNTWKVLNEKRYYFDITGAAYSNGLHWIDKILYAFDGDDSCELLTNTEITVDGTVFVVDENGVATEKEQIPDLVITKQPENAMGALGEEVSHTVQAENAASYIWYYSQNNGKTWNIPKNFAGYNTETLRYTLTPARLKYQFRCVVTGLNGNTVTSDIVHAEEKILDVVITQQPENVKKSLGEEVSHTVKAEHASAYLWYYSSDNGKNWNVPKNFVGYNTDTVHYKLTAARLKYQFRCVITGSNGSTITSDIVYVTEK